MIKKILLIGLFAALLPLALFGAKNVTKAEEIEELTKADVIGMFTQFNTDIAEDIKNQDSLTFVYRQNANMIKKWLKYYRFIELDTEIDRSWYEKVIKLLVYMGECKGYLTRFVHKNERDKSEKYQQVLANLKEARKNFAELIKKPTPVEQSKLKKLREEKYKSEDSAR